MEKEKLDILKQYSRGELHRFDVMKKLDMTYTEVLRKMAEHKLPMFQLPDEQLQKIADGFTAFMKRKF